MLYSQVFKFLKSAQKKEALSHAYLFSGARGIGKKETAFLFFNWLLKTSASCSSLNNNDFPLLASHPDFLHIQAEKEIKISQIRKIKKFLGMTSFKAKYKCVLLTDAEKMNIPAQNAFLKTIEEPSKNSILILTSANKSELLKTILSRVNIVNFSLSPLKSYFENNQDKKNYIFGRQGLALNKNFDIIMQEKENQIKQFLALKNSSLCEKFLFAKELAKKEKDEQKIYSFLESLVLYFRDQLLNCYGMQKKIIFSKINNESHISSAQNNLTLALKALNKLNLNLNKEMVLEEVFLKLNY